MIPVKLETLLEGKVVEANRVEYKEGWNPQEVVQALCAFANDYENVNGGYLVVGIKAEDGIPTLPPVGILKNRVDDIQKELFEYCNKIEPRYIPNFEIPYLLAISIMLSPSLCSLMKFSRTSLPL